MVHSFWLSEPPKVCQLCDCAITKTFIDGRVAGQSSWANMCLNCHHSHGNGLGIGKGQKYELQADGRWLKTEG